MKSIISLLLLLSGLLSFAQEKDKVIFRAMEDEMHRSMDSLSFNDYPTPFFIAYMLYDTDWLEIRSEIGGLESSKKDFNRSWGVRLMIGDYSVNDENFLNYGHNPTSMSTMWGSPNFPIDLDYLGMRNSWWLITDNIYRRAVNSYENKLKTIREHELEDHELLFDDFSKEEVVELIVKKDRSSIDKEMLEQKANSLSAACLNLPGVSYTTTEVLVNMSDAYLLNSEGTRYKVPLDLTTLALNLQAKDKDKETYNLSMKVICQDPEQLPSNDIIMKDAGNLAEILTSITKALPMDEDYFGPVLFEGNIASYMLAYSLFTNEEKLIAERQFLNSSFNNVYFEPLNNNLQKKMNKRILPEEISIHVYPTLNQYRGVSMLGASIIDYEGVKPPDSLILVENGYMRNMLSSRIPTSVTKHSNGHYRIYPSSFTVFSGVGPGVIAYKVSKTIPEDEVKAKFIDHAKEEGLDYAYIIRNAPGNVALMPAAIYKIDLETGTETLVKKGTFKSLLEIRDFKDIRAYGSKVNVGNLNSHVASSSNYDDFYRLEYYEYNYSGSIVSVIAPNSFIIDDFTIESSKQFDQLDKQKDYLPNPITVYKEK